MDKFGNVEESDAHRSVWCDWANCLCQTGLIAAPELSARDLGNCSDLVHFVAKDGLGVGVEGAGGTSVILLARSAST